MNDVTPLNGAWGKVQDLNLRYDDMRSSGISKESARNALAPELKAAIREIEERLCKSL